MGTRENTADPQFREDKIGESSIWNSDFFPGTCVPDFGPHIHSLAHCQRTDGPITHSHWAGLAHSRDYCRAHCQALLVVRYVHVYAPLLFMPLKKEEGSTECTMCSAVYSCGLSWGGYHFWREREGGGERGHWKRRQALYIHTVCAAKYPRVLCMYHRTYKRARKFAIKHRQYSTLLEKKPLIVKYPFFTSLTSKKINGARQFQRKQIRQILNFSQEQWIDVGWAGGTLGRGHISRPKIHF